MREMGEVDAVYSSSGENLQTCFCCVQMHCSSHGC